MRVLFVTSEVATLYKRGGLADVSYALPVALAKAGADISLAMPYYQKLPTKNVVCVGQLAVDFDRRRELVFVFRMMLADTKVPVYLFRHPNLDEYDGDRMADRFAFFSKAVAKLMLYGQPILGGPIDIVHCHDWHTALIPMLIGEHRKEGFRELETIESRSFATILTIHNLLYKGETGLSIGLKLGLPKTLFHTFMTPFGRAVRLLYEGIEYADRVTTVSPTYAREISDGVHGKRILDVISRRDDRMLGILNGLDEALWDPKTDTALPTRYSGTTMKKGKATVKAHLKKAVGLPDVDVPLFGFVGRLEDRQKGLDLIARAIEKLPDTQYQLVLLGTGQKRLVTLFEKLAKKHHNISFIHTFDERLARRIYAGSDIMLVPSKFEPCGLTQLIAMRYGTLPLVRKTGGLADTVTDGISGFVFGPYTSTALSEKMKEAIDWYTNKPKRFWLMSKTVMKLDFSWDRAVKNYLALYKRLM